MSAVCSYYLRGSCRFGNRCWNSHDIGSTRSDSPYIVLEDSSDDQSSFVVTTSRETTPMTNSPSSSAKQKNQVLPNLANKSSETNAAAPQDKWSLTNNNTGEARVGTPDSMLIETVKKLNEAENLVVSLRQQLRVKNEGDNFSWMEHQMEKCLESDLQCNICYEVFIKPTVLNCSHTFCHDCIESWTRRVNHCPTCRVYVKTKSYCLTLDTYLDKISDCLPDETKTRRETLKVERHNNRVEVNSRSRRNNARRRHHRNQTMRQTLGVLWGERDRDGAEWNIALEEALFDPIRLGDVIGRNRDDRDEWEDELSDSTLDSYEFFCSYCDNMGHSTSNCPIFIMEDTDEI
ncbi:PREDICTED: E3 ubiquitin-protein ligase RNF8-B-like isoform X2 [Diuraphis noxia]|uniref:E3 ubiquitin-protein ligase RNF8-B-like isoform X2 n=1 Tax=Diuraphis noxia TaxID=143948 RepID=UPI00076377C1|nr:PREDICTED: E3 ubiquitin-protein ligase RNF8-B-like isoform X2 [Diuraphis noxia]